MIVSLVRYHKPIAWLFTGLFYLELVLTPVAANAAMRKSIPLPHRYSAPAADNLRMAKANSPANGLSALSLSDPSAAIEPKSASATGVTTPASAVALTPLTGSVSTGQQAPAAVRQPFTTGPTQPEMQSFQSVNASNMVDLFTGDFSYNIPLLDVGGYPVNLHYSSGITMDQEASWVGLGWNINPGTITRNMRGLPDDFQGKEDAVTKTVSMKPNKTFGVTIGGNIELLGKSQFAGASKVVDSSKGRLGSLGASFGLFHNTYKGWGTETGLNVSINSGLGAAGGLTSSLSLTNNSQSGLDISPSFSYHMGKNESKTRGEISIGTNYNSRLGIQELQITGQVRQHIFSYQSQSKSTGVALPSYISFAKPSYTPTITVPYTSNQQSYTAKVGTEHWALHPNGYMRGYLSKQEIDPKDRELAVPSYGYLYYDKKGDDANVLLDFNREKDISFNQETPHIAMPIYTYDTYSISGEGTGGMFRPYRGDIGFVHDHIMSTKSKSDRLSVDIGLGTVVHGGVDFTHNDSKTTSGPWLNDNHLKDVVRFRAQDAKFENVYFKNPGEKTVVNSTFLNSIGGDSLVRVDLSPLNAQQLPTFQATRNLSVFSNSKLARKVPITDTTYRRERDKRTQVISYLTAFEASKVGLDTMIKSFGLNQFPGNTCSPSYSLTHRVGSIRKAHHLSEITVLNGDGRRYVYGIPVYNKSQTEVTMSVDRKGNASTGQVEYNEEENSVDNKSGKEGYYNKELMPAYAHSFLLSGILSPDYADLTNDGITEDDNGEAIKFNYTQIYTTDNPYRWRAPYGSVAMQAAYNEGLKTDSRDERASFSYGERDVWYLNSIESKTMVATFVVETDSLRQDGFGVKGLNGEQDLTQKLYRLKQINLYTKSDYLKNGTNAKPIKTVHFGYSYDLCKGNPGSANTGKLTLTKVWFTYNKNNKGALNPYVFKYSGKNPGFAPGQADRWGSYKNPAKNPGNGTALTNADYSYTLQESTTWTADSAAAYAAPWTLTDVTLPTGGNIKVSYESDDYAYVQNKRAMQFFNIAGFGATPTGVITPNLTKWGETEDYFHVFINLKDAVSSRADFERKYLEGVNQLYFKIAVNVPGDTWGSGYEFIPCYAEIENFDIKPGTENKTVWIQVKKTPEGYSPMATAAVQFLRLNLPSKAYPFSEPGDNFNLKNVLGMLASVAANIRNTVAGFPAAARRGNRMNVVETDKSFVRLNNPVYRKFGGGLRVKRVEVKDNWKKMTDSAQVESTYGQDYTYTTEVKVDGTPVTISSGVASYEPTLGGDENPFHVPLKVWKEKTGKLAPTDYLYSEEPFGETFFPAPMVGYSKVKVQTIHRKKKSANGFDVSEFYTSKDFPTIVEYTPIDNETKKTFNPPINNVFKFNAHNDVTLSQGFKVELNDMNGKSKSQSSFSQTDSVRPINYTYNYYRLENDNAFQPKLSNRVTVVDSANGVLRSNAEIGKEVDIMIDLREQISVAEGGNVEANVDWVHAWPPIFWFPMVPLPTKETNMYRSVAVTKVVNRYGILDSVIHLEKGSRVTTRDLVYDAETGATLVNQTNNEFDDPIYSFNYPAHWAYSGMGSAYKNIGATLTPKTVKQGIMYNLDGSLFDAAGYFESGDEMLVAARDERNSSTTDDCSPLYYIYNNKTSYKRLWAIDASKGYQNKKGVYFIDTAGRPYNGEIATLKIIRSGKRNMQATALGSVTSLISPIKNVGGKDRIVIDSTAEVIASNAVRFKDLWKVDNVWKMYDSCVTEYKSFSDGEWSNRHIKTVALLRQHIKDRTITNTIDNSYNKIVVSWQRFNKDEFRTRSLIQLDLSDVPTGAIITHARLDLFGDPPKNMWQHNPWVNPTVSYEGIGERVEGRVSRYPFAFYGNELNFPWVTEKSIHDAAGTTARLPWRGFFNNCYNDTVNITSIIQNMLTLSPEYQSLIVKLDTEAPMGDGKYPVRYMSYKGKTAVWNPYKCSQVPCVDACGASVILSYTYPVQRCYQVCRSEVINKDTLNPYRYGILGNWRVDTAFTYYGARKQSVTATATNIRTDGAIKDFLPYWKFNSSSLQAAPDSTRWVWNSKTTLVNGKGAEIESKDPLGRYNAGLYGYNNTLPIAVAQNSRLREITFEGFEDRDYKSNPCVNCSDNGWIKAKQGSISPNISHSGSASFRVNTNGRDTTKVAIGTAASDTVSTKVSLQVDSIPIVKQTVTPKGNGLLTQYGTFYASWGRNINRCVGHDIPWNQTEWSSQTAISTPNQQWPEKKGPGPLCAGWYYTVKWTGKLQPELSGAYRFKIDVDDEVVFKINGAIILAYEGTGPKTIETTTRVMLNAGQLYDVELIVRNNRGPGGINLYWAKSWVEIDHPVPVTSWYQNATQANGSVVNDTTWCVKFRNPVPVNAIHQKFTPVQGSKMVFSAWVKEEVPCAAGSSYNSGQVRLTFNNGSGVSYVLKPKGNIIEGWQRIEEVVDIPANVTEMNVFLETGGIAAYFDDLRMHPFSSNMKSFVYDPVNLRLMAELDENNHATFYEYDDEGTLIRVKKETERGIKTIRETRSATLKPINN
ncbi:PA14 domain-containing protein [Paraflavitalea sp. CAU 1676]|uniref:PA14 domain-containing protein n=1 Tax=Paraflavitalea sp. CAU 1676 TaxID=3032598 RepID=UPI0023D9DDC0|nr:PA14 domain-containing protein [Paraflavitalea sp. CAU 1676]MDF2188423.1 PA14 domain-containing protein [Paraflavitalea sp. CAU 1676]